MRKENKERKDVVAGQLVIIMLTLKDSMVLIEKAGYEKTIDELMEIKASVNTLYRQVKRGKIK